MTSEEQSDSPLRPLSRQRREWLEKATTTFTNSITREAAAWLKARGVEKEDALGSRLGLVATDYPGFERYAGWLSIPYLAADGHPVSMRFRRPDWVTTDGPKYLGFAEEKARVYNVESFMGSSPDIHIAEGEFDTLILKKVFGSAVGYPGANVWKKHHRVLFAGFSNVYVWGDGDEAGRKFTEEMVARIRSANPVYLPSGEDVTSLYMKHGADGLRGLIA
ncbi:toprim domain-containing protein [Puerhibacterium puerhi]|uniref:toprim domain-containing protein n=1 Tax=Puerhibacterium puerhi TaxID=2692623 RepID=UPI001F3830BC|nr:toprim domain-containing protein [Puerhibacterium puerhi]